MARIIEAIGPFQVGALTCVEAASLLRMSERHSRRLRDACAGGGSEAIIDRRRGNIPSNNPRSRSKTGSWRKMSRTILTSRPSLFMRR
jgi:hypothetical protein